MFVCPEHKVVFVAIPKTGTRSIYHTLQTKYGGQLVEDHKQVIPPKYQQFFSFCVVRNPYDRICSAYWSTCRRTDDRYGYKTFFKNRGLPDCVDSYMVAVAATVFKRVNHNVPQYRFIDRNRIDRVLRFETLNEDFKMLPFLVDQEELPVANHHERPHWSEMLNGPTIKAVNKFFAKDFETFGYDMVMGND